MKIRTIFAMPKYISFVKVVAIFYAIIDAYLALHRAIKSQWLLHSRGNCTLASMGGDSLSYIN